MARTRGPHDDAALRSQCALAVQAEHPRVAAATLAALQEGWALWKRGGGRAMAGKVTIVGGGLAGVEAAWQLAQAGTDVTLHEMKPARRSPAHKLDGLAELVCSNSLRSDNPENAVGLLHEELRRLGSLVLACADATRVPAGDALAVDRERFSALVTERLRAHPLVRMREEEVTRLPDGPEQIGRAS